MVFALITTLQPGHSRADPYLLMIEQAICEWCERWNDEVGVVYAKTPEGQTLPLVRADIRDPQPNGLSLETRPMFTPTFIVIKNGAEFGRIEGYPGEDFFYGLLQELIKKL